MPDLAPHGPQREVLVLANPRSGSRNQRWYVRELLRELRERGLKATLCETREELSALAGARAGQLHCVVAAGGDGTFNEVLNRAPGAPVAVLPLGTENLVARYFRVGRSPSRLARAIASAPLRHFDLGRAHGRLFSLVVGVGLDARVVHDVHRARHGHISKWDYVLPTLRALATYPFPAVEATIEETGEQLWGATVFVFNLPIYALGLRIGQKAQPDDGWLDLLVFQRPGRIHLARYFGAVLCGRHDSLPDVQHRRARRIHLRSAQAVPVQVDGDPAGALPLTVEVAPGALGLLAPGGPRAKPEGQRSPS